MADEPQYSPDSGSNKRKYEEPTNRRVTGFSAPILPSSSPDSVPTSYSSVPPPVDDIQLAKQRAQEIAARLYNTASSGAAATGGLETTKRPRVDNGGGYDSDRGYGSIPSDAKPYSAPSSIPVSYGFQGGSKKIAVPNGRILNLHKMGKKSKSKTPKENSVVEKPIVEKEKGTFYAEKATQAKKPASVIDEIFAGEKRKKAEAEKAKKQSEEASEKQSKLKRRKKRDLGFKDGAFVDETSGPKKRTKDGLAIYTEEELGLNKADAGSTPLCPFDCECCF